ncbi:cytochrome c oxidase subunit 1, partial [Podochytrium sp. JEL0797]
MTSPTAPGGLPAGWVEDMTALPDLSEPAILNNLKNRFQDGFIYTYTGSILVAVNPYKPLDIFGHATISKYESHERQHNPPHIFALSESAIRNLRSEKRNQSVIISGESGSGKSESTKYILSYLTAVTSHHSNVSWIHQQILEANTVLESFGNAKTSRNNNSSRFGKFIQVQLDKKLEIIGANITSYLLEKSRVARQSKSERNYHVFYEFAQGANEEEVNQYLIKPTESYYYLSQSGCTEIPGVDPRSKFEGLKFSLTVLNISADGIDSILRVLSAILWLGNVTFKAESGNESVRIDDKETIRSISTLLGVNEGNLNKVMCFKKLVVRSETTMVPLKPSQATDNRDSIAKNLYSNLFRVLLELINSTLQATADKEIQNYIGVLDIFGFEDFTVNSFEQLCINYTNEKLQNFFNQFIFKLEQEEYEKEGISWEKISYEDNQACIDLIEDKPKGILAQLDEEVKLPKGSEESFLMKLEKTHEKHKHFTKPKLKNGIFGIKHYAGEVLYNVEGFLEKNKDALQEELYDLISSSTVPFISALITPKENDSSSSNALNSHIHINHNVPSPKMSQKSTKLTAGGTFRNQLNSLVMTLGMTTTHYVRCIKPNSQMQAFLFEDIKVLSQLRYSGMLETIKIRKSGFPVRISFEKFNMENRFILSRENKLSEDPREKAKSICVACNLPEGSWQAGHSKIFMRAENITEIQKRTADIQKASVLTIQRYVRGFQARAKYQKIRKNAIIIQKHVKGYLFVVRYKRQKKAILKIQSAARMWFAKAVFRKLQAAKLKALKEEQERKEKELRRLRELEAAEMERLATERMMAELRAAQLKLQEAAQLKKRQEEEKRRLEEIEAAKEKQKAATEKELAEKNALMAQDKVAAEKDTAAISALDNLIGKVEEKIAESRDSRVSSTGASSLDPEPTPLTKKPTADNKLDEIFSFIKDFNSHDELAALAQNLTTEINELYEKKKVLLSNENIAEAAPRASEFSKASSDSDMPNRSSTEKSTVANPLTTQERNSAVAELTDGKMDPFADAVSLQSFGDLHFAQANKKKGLLPALQTKKNPIASPVTRIEEGDASYALALECSKLLLKAMDPTSKKQEDICIAMHQIVQLGLAHLTLRDEIFIQIIKQVTPPLDGEPKGWSDITLNGWQVLTLCIGAFPPSKVFSKFLLAFILRGCKTNSSTKRMLSLTAELFSKSVLMYGARKFAPTIADIQSFREGNVNRLCKIYVMDGHSFDILISPVTTADEVVKEIGKKFKLKDTASWSLFTVTSKTDRAIRSVEYLADCICGSQKESKKETFLTSLLLNKQKEENTVP